MRAAQRAVTIATAAAAATADTIAVMFLTDEVKAEWCHA